MLTKFLAIVLIVASTVPASAVEQVICPAGTVYKSGQCWNR